MPTKIKTKHYPLSDTAKIILVLSLLVNIVALLVVAYYYPTLPSTVVTHSGLNGATTYGQKASLLIAPGIFIAIFVLILLILRYRYTLLEKYPYLLSLPSFVYKLGMQKDSVLEGKVINKVFTVYSLSAFYISVLNLIISISLMLQDMHFLPEVVFGTVIVFVLTVFALYKSIYQSFTNKKA